MSWQKEGRILAPEKYSRSWMSSHAAMPFAENLERDRYRIYFSPRDTKNQSHVASFEIDINNPSYILQISEQPLLSPGTPGNFDDAGAMISWVINKGEEQWMYYIGWNLSVAVPFRNALGLAISHDGRQTFRRYSEGPILDRSIYDPALVASACILPENNIWRMWYLSGIGWVPQEDSYQHKYHIKYAESKDGVNWERTGLVCIDFQNENEYAISRPCVIKESGIYRMWYSYRGPAYRIGYAESLNGFDWVRKDKEVGIDVSPSGWDSEMIEYPYVFRHGNKKVMLYNGNRYGKTGIGLAISNE